MSPGHVELSKQRLSEKCVLVGYASSSRTIQLLFMAGVGMIFPASRTEWVKAANDEANES